MCIRDSGIMAHNLIGIGGSNSDTHCSIDSWGLMGDGTILLYNRTYDTHGRFCRIYLAGDTVTGAARYRTHDTPIYNSLTELVNGYNTSSSLQNYVYFTKGAGFGSILFDNPSSYDIILEGFRFSYKGLLQTAVDAWCSDRLSAENIYGHISDWNTRDITDMSNLFDNKNTFNDDISRWDVSNVTTMTAMFGNCTVFNQPLNSWNVSNVESFRWMFYNCSDFNQPLNNWDTSSLIDIGYMFRGATSFNQNISNWNVSNVLHSELPWHEGCPIDDANKPAGL